MAEASSIGAAFENYQGNAALGGASLGVLDIDTKPLQQLAAYTTMYNKSVWDQKQKETDAQVKELADLSNISLNDLRGKDRDQAAQEFADLQQYASDYIKKVPKNAQERMQNELEWQTKKGAFMNNFGSGKQRSISYLSHLNTIKNNITDAKAQNVAIAALDKQFDSTDIGTQISALPQYKLQNIDVSDPSVQKVHLVGVGPNQNLDVESTLYNPKLNTGKADETVFGVVKAYPKNGTPEYDNLSDNEKQQADMQGTVESNGKIWNDMANPLNSVLQAKSPDGALLYFDGEGSFNAAKFEDDNASNSVVMKAYNALKGLDSYSRTKYNEASTGVFNDKGLSFKLPENVNPDDFKSGFIDFKKGVTPAQLVQAGMFAKYAGDVTQKKITETNNALEAARLGETIRHNKASEGLQGREIKMNEDKWKNAQKGSEPQINGAMQRAKRIYSDLLKLADKEGTISPDKVRQLNVEQLKYLGIEAPTERDPTTGAIISQGGFKPLDLSPAKDNEGNVIPNQNPYVIQLVNGQVKVLRNAHPSQFGGSYKGEWDNTKSTNIFNIGTNILNEELKNSGAKELNAYTGVDLTDVSSGGQPDNTSAGTKSMKGKDGKIYTSTDGITWTAPDGTTVKLKSK